MPRPTREQLNKINKFAHTPLEEDQVYVFKSLSADTLPIERMGWFGRYDIIMTSRMLNKLKEDYRKGVGLLASHDNNRLPFGRTFDAEVKVDYVDGEPVETLYIDHYIVTHVKDEEGNKVPLRTEINGMTTQDIVNHIEVGHTFDTSIGFAITEPKCSICKNDIRDHTKCKHVPGMKYDVQVGEETVQKRCDIIADYGEGIENSLVYAGAVNRALIQHQKYSKFTEDSEYILQGAVNNNEMSLYNVDDIKKVPLQSAVYCKLSKGKNMELFTLTPDRVEYEKGSEEMPTNQELSQSTAELKDVVLKEQYDKVVSEKEELSTKLSDAEAKVVDLEKQVSDLQEKLSASEAKVDELTVKAQLADSFTEDLIQETVKAGIQARGNSFNKERYEKYLRTLSVDEIKEELKAFRQEFPGSIEAARVTKTEVEEREDEPDVQMSMDELRQLAAKRAMERFKRDGGNLEKMTKEELSKLLEKHEEK